LSDDPGIATLSEVLDPIVLAKHLRSVSRAPWNGHAIEQVQTRVLKHYFGRRCTLEIGLRTEKGWHFLIGKVYSHDRPDIFQTMERIQQVSFGPQDEFSIPQPVAYLAPLRCFVQEKVEGPIAKEIFKKGDEGSRALAAERCGLWLAKFHTRAPKAGSVSYAKDYLESDSMQRWCCEMAKLGGPLADKVVRLLKRLENVLSSLSPVEMCPGHGGYRPTHVILVPGRTVTFDLDTYDVADPARDVARFLSALRNLALVRFGSIRMLDGAVESFLDAYLTVGSPDAKRNLCFFMAASCLKRAMRSLGRSIPHGQENAEAMLEEGLRVTGMGAAL
jgi:aminoglycoside phosphotransferase (APT) family kinase protein